MVKWHWRNTAKRFLLTPLFDGLAFYGFVLFVIPIRGTVVVFALLLIYLTVIRLLGLSVPMANRRLLRVMMGSRRPSRYYKKTFR